LAAEQSCLGSSLLHSVSLVIKQHLPTLVEQLSELPDIRQRKTYEIEELVFAAIMLYVLKQETRHGLNQKRKTAKFKKNYERCFKMRLPHMDTVTDVLEVLHPKLLEQLSIDLVKLLLRKRIFHKYRLLNKYFLVAVDATGYASYEKAPNWPCPHKTSKNGKTWWTQPILCAKLVFPNGLCIHLLTEWIINESEYDKQDCETKAFKRMAPKLKAFFPRLPICILADALYATGPFFEICKSCKWSFIVVFKDTKLKTLWAQVNQQTKNKNQTLEELDEYRLTHKAFQWVNNLTYQGRLLHWVEANIEEQKTINHQIQCTNKHRFVCLTNLMIDQAGVESIIRASRLRWKIENEGFNSQKNGGYKLQHKMSRTNFFAIQNFLCCLQIGHLINQLITYSTHFKQKIQQHFTLKHCWQVLNAFLIYGQFLQMPTKKFVFRYS